MNYNKLTKKELIKKIELLENVEIGIQVIAGRKTIIIDPDRKIKNMACIVTNQSFDNKEHIMFTVKTGILE